jgi:hypothetical protein
MCEARSKKGGGGTNIASSPLLPMASFLLLLLFELRLLPLWAFWLVPNGIRDDLHHTGVFNAGHFIDCKIARSSLSIGEVLTRTDLGESLKVLGVLLS